MAEPTSDVAQALNELRQRLANLSIQKVPVEQFLPVNDSRADQEAKAIASGHYDDIEAAHKRAETQNIVEGNRDKRINRKLRWRYARLVFCYLVAYSIFVGALLIAGGFRICGFMLPESVMGFLVGSTAAAAIGLVYAVTSGLFGGAK